MKRQERLALFLEREKSFFDEMLQTISGYTGLYFGARCIGDYRSISHIFFAGPRSFSGVDAVFNDHEWPLLHDYFDMVLLDHPLDLGCDLSSTLAEAIRVLRRDGTLIITGFNKTRLCSWPIQNTFAKVQACPLKKRYSALSLLSLLDEAGFVTEIRYFDFCRFRWLNKIFAKILPFLGIGFFIIAKRKTIDLQPLGELNWKFEPKKILAGTLQPEPECCGEKRDVRH